MAYRNILKLIALFALCSCSPSASDKISPKVDVRQGGEAVAWNAGDYILYEGRITSFQPPDAASPKMFKVSNTSLIGSYEYHTCVVLRGLEKGIFPLKWTAARAEGKLVQVYGKATVQSFPRNRRGRGLASCVCAVEVESLNST